MTILGMLAALLFPVIGKAILSAKSNQSLSNLKQLALATNLYRSDYGDGIGSFPPPEQLLASNGSILGKSVPPLLKSACGKHTNNSFGAEVIYTASEGVIGFHKGAMDQVPIYMDPNCNDEDVVFDSPFYRKRTNYVLESSSAKSEYSFRSWQEILYNTR